MKSLTKSQGFAIFLRFAAASLAAGGLFLASAQTTKSVWDGVYSTDQAKQGDQDYHRDCASCHGAALQGRGQAPSLAGSGFTGNWDGMTVGDLFEKIQSAMPADRPGQLTQDENAGILAYILQANKFPSGPAALTSDIDAAKKIRFEAAPAK
jgi:S-disulfanyl-L-cysteine oxidoreductase SoxD